MKFFSRLCCTLAIGAFLFSGLFAITSVAQAQPVPNQPLVAPLENPISGNPSISTILARVVTAILGIIGSITLVAFVYGGFLWLTSAGASDKVKKGLNTMVYALIGLFIIFAAYAILETVITALR